MPPTYFDVNEISNRIASREARAESYHAALYHLGIDEAALVLWQPAVADLRSPYCSKNQVEACFLDSQIKGSVQELKERFSRVHRIYLLHKAAASVTPVRVCSERLQFIVQPNKDVTSDLRLLPPLTLPEWERLGNFWKFRVEINYEYHMLFNESDVRDLYVLLTEKPSFCMNITRFQGDSFSMLCDHLGCSINYIDFNSCVKLYSVNENSPRKNTYVQRYIEEIGEETEDNLATVIPKPYALLILQKYLANGSLSELKGDKELFGEDY